MRSATYVKLTLLALVLASAATAVRAQDPAAAPEKSDWEKFVQQTKNPTEWLSWGGDIRLREIFAPNLLLDREDRHFQRYRFRTWASIEPIENIQGNVRLTWEPRHYCQPSRTAVAGNARILDEWTLNEAIIDALNVKWKKICGLPLTATVGRQDIILGEGWLVLDGTPLDGSRTIFFDAARVTAEFPDAQTTVDLIYIHQHADSDWWLKPICDKDFHNHEQDEQGAIVYLTNKSLEKTQIDGFFIYKRDENQVFDAGTAGVAPWQRGKEGELYTIGGSYAYDFTEKLSNKTFGAYQWGHTFGEDVCAFAFKNRLTYFLRDDLNNNFRLAYEYLSGDKPGTDNIEQFDPLWGRWPQFSELFVYPVALEARPGEVTNLHRVSLGWSCNPHKQLEFCADWHILFTDKNSFSDRPFFSDSGCFKGNILAGLLRYKFTPHISGHVLAELFFPGDYYSDLRNETAGFFRFDLTFTW